MAHDIALHRTTHDLAFVEVPRTDPDAVPRYDIIPIDGADRVAQQVKITLLAFRGEWFLDTGFGVPYLTDVLVKNPNLPAIESILRARILAVPDVQRLESFSLVFDQARRRLVVAFTATTPLGPINETIHLGAVNV